MNFGGLRVSIGSFSHIVTVVVVFNLVNVFDKGEALHVWQQGVYEKSLIFFSIAMNLKLLKQVKSLRIYVEKSPIYYYFVYFYITCIL